MAVGMVVAALESRWCLFEQRPGEDVSVSLERRVLRMFISLPSASLLAHLLLGAAPLALPQEGAGGVESAPAVVDARILVHTGRPLLVSWNMSTSIRLGPVEAEAECDFVFVDEFAKFEEGLEEATRHFLKSQVEINGEVMDPPFTGLRLWFEQRGGDLRVKCLDERVITQSLVNQLLDTCASVGLWLTFPESVQVGDELVVDFMPVTTVLCGWEAKATEATATLRLDAYDSESELARFSGRLRIVEEVNEPDLRGVWTWEGDCRFVSNLAEDRIVRIEYEGQRQFTGSGVAEKGEGEFSVEIETEIGKKVSRAVRAKPKYRERIFPMPAQGLSIELPSYWTKSNTGDPSKHLYFRTLEHDADQLMISVTTFEGRVTNPKEYFKSLDADAEGDPDLVKTASVSCKLGKGHAHVYEYTDDEGNDMFVRSEYYVVREALTLVKYSGIRKAAKKHLREFEQARKSLGKTR